jgi:hypothetical protein
VGGDVPYTNKAMLTTRKIPTYIQIGEQSRFHDNSQSLFDESTPKSTTEI